MRRGRRGGLPKGPVRNANKSRSAGLFPGLGGIRHHGDDRDHPRDHDLRDPAPARRATKRLLASRPPPGHQRIRVSQHPTRSHAHHDDRRHDRHPPRPGCDSSAGPRCQGTIMISSRVIPTSRDGPIRPVGAQHEDEGRLRLPLADGRSHRGEGASGARRATNAGLDRTRRDAPARCQWRDQGAEHDVEALVTGAQSY
jgi:hypothetical protein